MKKLLLLLLFIISIFMISCNDKADYDLSKGNMMDFTTLQNVTSDYKQYLGKYFKISGEYSKIISKNKPYYIISFYDPSPQQCCSPVEIEFILNNGEYPKAGTYITIYGRLEEYSEGTKKYIHLVDTKVC